MRSGAARGAEAVLTIPRRRAMIRAGVMLEMLIATLWPQPLSTLACSASAVAAANPRLSLVWRGLYFASFSAYFPVGPAPHAQRR